MKSKEAIRKMNEILDDLNTDPNFRCFGLVEINILAKRIIHVSDIYIKRKYPQFGEICEPINAKDTK